MKNTEEKEFLTFDEAIERLPDGEYIHTFRDASIALLGADLKRVDLLADMKLAKAIEVTGPAAQEMHHGIAILDDFGYLFIETRKK